MSVIKLEPAPANYTISGCSNVPVLVTDKITFKLDLVEPSPELAEKARNELRETPEVVEQAKKELRDLLREEEGLDCPYEMDQFLLRFLRPTKFYPESAFKLIKNYYEFKIKHKNVYEGLVPSKEKNVFSHDIITVLPRRDQGGRRILILTLGKKWKHNKVSLDEVYKGAVLFSEAAMLEPESQISGAQIIFDMDGLSLQQTWQFTPPFAKRIVDWLQDSIPLRIKGLHIVNQPYIFNVVFSLFKPFLREKLKSRIIFHGSDRKSLHQHLDPSCLPEAFGGTLDIPPFHGLDWHEMLLKIEPEYEKINSYGYKKAAK